MKIFEHFNKSTKCFICGKNSKGKAVLLPIDGTVKDGIVECEQVHLDCLLKQEFRINKDRSIIYTRRENATKIRFVHRNHSDNSNWLVN